MDKYSTDNVNQKTLPHHGAIDFSIINDNIILYQANGPLNKALFLALEEIEPKVIKELKKTQGDWCEIVIFIGSCHATDEFLAELTEYAGQIKQNGFAPVASAYVISDETEGSDVMKPRYKQCYTDAGLIFSTFDKTQDAIQWAHSHLSHSDNP